MGSRIKPLRLKKWVKRGDKYLKTIISKLKAEESDELFLKLDVLLFKNSKINCGHKAVCY